MPFFGYMQLPSADSSIIIDGTVMRGRPQTPQAGGVIDKQCVNALLVFIQLLMWMSLEVLLLERQRLGMGHES